MYSNGKVTAPVDTTDVSKAIGIASEDTGTLCSSSNINKWAKFKPTRVAANATDDWASAFDGSYGIHIDLETADKLAVDNRGFSYALPDGITYPYRLGDFRGYNHNAEAAFYFESPSSLYYNTGSGILVFGMSVRNSAGDNLILRDFLSAFDTLYWGVKMCIKNNDGTYSNAKYITDSANIISETPNGITLDLTDSKLSDFNQDCTITFIPFLSTTQISTWSSGFTGVTSIISLGTHKDMSVSYYTPPEIWRLDAFNGFLFGNGATIRLAAKFTNVSANTLDFRWDLIKVVRTDKKGTSSKLSPTFTTGGGMPSVAPGESTTASFSIAGSTSVDDTYSATVELFYYQQDFSQLRSAGAVTV